MDSGSLLGDRPPTTSTATTGGRAWSVLSTKAARPDERMRNWIGNEPRPVSVGGPAVNWAEYVNVKSVQYIKMDHALNVDAEEPNDWDLGNAVRETEKQFTTYLRLLMTDNKRSKPPQNACLSRTTTI